MTSHGEQGGGHTPGPWRIRENPPNSPRLGLACGAVADAVFYRNSDASHRSKLALALVDLAQEIQRGIELAREDQHGHV